MAALDFPSSPTLNQQYAAPNGVTYQWDGAAWIVTGGPANLWTDTGTALTPTTATKQVRVAGPTGATVDMSQIVAGVPTPKARLIHNQSLALSYLTENVALTNTAPNWAQDDVSKSSWALSLNAASDLAVVGRIPAGSTTMANLLLVDNAGNVTMPGVPATGSPAVIVGAASGGGKARFLASNAQAGAIAAVLANRDYAGNEDDATRPAWGLFVHAQADVTVIQRQPAGSASPTTIFTVDSAGNLTITGATGTKASGTTWANPSDPRLKTDVAPYAASLAEVVQLAPITYHLKADPDGPLCYGFDAEKVRAIFPECVSTTRMKLDPADEEETEVLTFDMHPILVALVNAVKELAAGVAHA